MDPHWHLLRCSSCNRLQRLHMYSRGNGSHHIPRSRFKDLTLTGLFRIRSETNPPSSFCSDHGIVARMSSSRNASESIAFWVMGSVHRRTFQMPPPTSTVCSGRWPNKI
ncbi:hypothetical protein OCA5_c03640 [Afipia carboxidovorans OM5]|uniref:Uncharacterized protein n=1 Tax=Afipia carboxidovorans (strain ATCC 49405 / DSM 1227 / KCTC 32145 / OM5) TaxID=504832 RepID=F8BUN7_AFIC5|nr:hypothetical protein OCA4_c03630 [Afipia carboxidovorans OM4]AEI05090.1 hypothetical protein OCA5_c03640 [Afipia carboxidovorans OM5]